MTQASRDHAWRRQAARLIVAAKGVRTWDLERRFDAFDQVFDVALVRAYCERLIAEADALDVAREVFADWTRARGKGPDFVRTPWWTDISDDGAPGVGDLVEGDARSLHTGRTWRVVGTVDSFGPGHDDCAAWRVWRLSQRDLVGCDRVRFVPRPVGWPGNLASEFVAEQRKRRRCSRPDCDGGLCGLDVFGEKWRTACPECESAATLRPSRAFANGGNMRRAAKRLLDTLDGRCPWNQDAEAQPSECDHCSYTIVHDEHGQAVAKSGRGFIHAGLLRSDERVELEHLPGVMVQLRECPKCNGTGHNLRGALPPLPHETDRKRTSKAVRFSRPWRGTMAEISAALHGVPNIGNVTVGERDGGLTIRWFGTATEAAVRRALEPVLPAAVGLELVPPDRR